MKVSALKRIQTSDISLSTPGAGSFASLCFFFFFLAALDSVDEGGQTVLGRALASGWWPSSRPHPQQPNNKSNNGVHYACSSAIIAEEKISLMP